jgi:hypothetical protein
MVSAREPIDRKHMSAAIDSLLDAGFHVLYQGRRAVSVCAPVELYQQILGYVPSAPAVVAVVPEKIASEYASLALYLGVFEFEAPTQRA